MAAELDAGSRARIDTANPRRVQRAWEVLTATGRGIAAWQDETGPPLLPGRKRDGPSSRGAARLAQPAHRGAFRRDARRKGFSMEARANRPGWHPRPCPRRRRSGAARSHWPTLDGSARSGRFCENNVAIQTRQYAKRQRSWFRARMSGWRRIDPGDALSAGWGLAENLLGLLGGNLEETTASGTAWRQHDGHAAPSRGGRGHGPCPPRPWRALARGGDAQLFASRALVVHPGARGRITNERLDAGLRRPQRALSAAGHDARLRQCWARCSASRCSCRRTPRSTGPRSPLHIRCRKGADAGRTPPRAHRTVWNAPRIPTTAETSAELYHLSGLVSVWHEAPRVGDDPRIPAGESGRPTGWRRPYTALVERDFRLLEGCRRLLPADLRRDAGRIFRAPAGRPAHAPRWHC